MSAPTATHIHLDPLGGVAGDMFIAAVLDAWPELQAQFEDAVRACALPPGWRVQHGRHLRGAIDGRTLRVCRPGAGAAAPGVAQRRAPGHHDHGHDHHGHDHGHEHHTGAHDHGHAHEHPDRGQDHGHAHDSGRYADIVLRIAGMALGAGARRRAQDIYRRLAECEAAVHGIAVQDVHFHELADWDSLVDIVGAATLIDALGPVAWSVASLPLGSGTVRTAHGPLPVPAPATARLLRDFVVHDDGIAGERVTPTGAAILAHLAPAAGRAGLRARVGATGIGAGTRELHGCANVLRLLSFHAETVTADEALHTDTVGVLELDIDDQTPEELATALEVLRAHPDVIDVVSRLASGKKGRAVFEVRVLCAPQALQAVQAACLTQTSSLGVRAQLLGRALLARQEQVVETAAGRLRVKLAERPGGARSAKAEHDDVRALGADQAARRRLAASAEAAALAARALPASNEE